MWQNAYPTPVAPIYSLAVSADTAASLDQHSPARFFHRCLSFSASRECGQDQLDPGWRHVDILLAFFFHVEIEDLISSNLGEYLAGPWPVLIAPRPFASSLIKNNLDAEQIVIWKDAESH